MNARYAGQVRKNTNVSSALHVCLHISGNIANFVLYDSFGANALGLGAARQPAPAELEQSVTSDESSPPMLQPSPLSVHP